MPPNPTPQALTTTEALLGRALVENHLLREQLQRQHAVMEKQKAEIEKIRKEVIALRGGSSGADEGDTPAPEA